MSERSSRTVNLTRFYRDWFRLLESGRPRRGEFTIMMFSVMGVVRVLGPEQARYLIEDAIECWVGWPDAAFEVPDPRVFSLPGPIEHLFEVFALLEIRLKFSLFDALSQELVERWQQGVRRQPGEPTRDDESQHDEPTTRFVACFDAIQDASLLTRGLEHMLSRDRSGISSHDDVIAGLMFAMWHRLDALAGDGHRVVHAPPLLRALLEHPRSGLWPNLFASANGVEVDDAGLLSNYNARGGRAPVIALDLEGDAGLGSALGDHLERLSITAGGIELLHELFAGAPSAPNLRALALRDMAPAGAEITGQLASTQAFGKLEELSLVKLDLDDSIADVLCEAPFRWLRSLDLGSNPKLTANALDTLLSHWKFSELEALSIAGSSIDHLLAVGESTYASSLCSLDVSYSRVNAEAAKEIVNLTGLDSLTSIDLSGNPLGSQGAASLALWSRLRRLSSLTLERCSVRGEGARAIASSIALQNLEHLDLRGNQLGPEGVRALAAHDARLVNLTSLDIAFNNLDLPSLRKLITSPRLSNLEYLCLGQNLDGSILEVLLKESELYRLKTLVLVITDLRAEYLEVLAHTPSMPHLENVEIFVRGATASYTIANLTRPFLPWVCSLPWRMFGARSKRASSLGPLLQIFREASVA